MTCFVFATTSNIEQQLDCSARYSLRLSDDCVGYGLDSFWRCSTGVHKTTRWFASYVFVKICLGTHYFSLTRLTFTFLLRTLSIYLCIFFRNWLKTNVLIKDLTSCREKLTAFTVCTVRRFAYQYLCCSAVRFTLALLFVLQCVNHVLTFIGIGLAGFLVKLVPGSGKPYVSNSSFCGLVFSPKGQMSLWACSEGHLSSANM